MKARLIKPSCGLHNLCVGNLNFLFSDLLLNLRTALFLNVTLICVFGTAEIRRTKRDLKGIISVKNSPLLMLADNLFETDKIFVKRLKKSIDSILHIALGYLG